MDGNCVWEVRNVERVIGSVINSGITDCNDRSLYLKTAQPVRLHRIFNSSVNQTLKTTMTNRHQQMKLLLVGRLNHSAGTLGSPTVGVQPAVAYLNSNDIFNLDLEIKVSENCRKQKRMYFLANIACGTQGLARSHRSLHEHNPGDWSNLADLGQHNTTLCYTTL